MGRPLSQPLASKETVPFSPLLAGSAWANGRGGQGLWSSESFFRRLTALRIEAVGAPPALSEKTALGRFQSEN